MAKSKDPYWPIPEATAVKHSILKRYLGAFMGVFFSTCERYGLKPKVVFIDGFAGPGKYYTDESRDPADMVPGSPLIVGELANGFRKGGKAHRKFKKAQAVIFAFEANPGTAKTLTENLAETNRFDMTWDVHQGTFEDGITNLLDYMEKNKIDPAPMFLFVDPFGFKGVPLIEVCRRLFAYDRVEVFFNFMYNDINRFVGVKDVREHMIKIFGGEDGLDELAAIKNDPQRRLQCTLERLTTAIQEHADFVLSFRMNDPERDRAKYFLVHASKNFRAFQLMKESMYKASDLEGELSALSQASKDLRSAFRAAAAQGDYEDWVLERLAKTGPLRYADGVEPFYVETTGVSKHYKAAARALAKKNAIVIQHKWDKNRQQGSFRDGDVLRLARPGESYAAHFKASKQAAGR